MDLCILRRRGTVLLNKNKRGNPQYSQYIFTAECNYEVIIVISFTAECNYEVIIVISFTAECNYVVIIVIRFTAECKEYSDVVKKYFVD